jgi:hypothetical protein
LEPFIILFDNRMDGIYHKKDKNGRMGRVDERRELRGLWKEVEG